MTFVAVIDNPAAETLSAHRPRPIELFRVVTQVHTTQGVRAGLQRFLIAMERHLPKDCIAGARGPQLRPPFRCTAHRRPHAMHQDH